MIVKIRVQPILSKVKVTVHLKGESENQGKAVFSKVKVKIRVKPVSSKMKVTVKGKGEIRVELALSKVEWSTSLDIQTRASPSSEEWQQSMSVPKRAAATSCKKKVI